MLHPALITKDTGTIQGQGLFTTESITQGTMLWELEDPTFSWAEVLEWSPERFTRFRHYGFQCGVDSYSLPEDISREANHSCNPNTWWGEGYSLVARWDIKAGDEITYDYASCDIELALEMTCHCGAQNCRKDISNQDYLDPAWQKQYGEHLPPHVLAAIDALPGRA